MVLLNVFGSDSSQVRFDFRLLGKDFWHFVDQVISLLGAHFIQCLGSCVRFIEVLCNLWFISAQELVAVVQLSVLETKWAAIFFRLTH